MRSLQYLNWDELKNQQENVFDIHIGRKLIYYINQSDYVIHKENEKIHCIFS